MKKTILILVALCNWLINPALAQQEKNEEINRIKRDLSYLTATGTSTTNTEEASENAKILIISEIEQWLSENAKGDISGYLAKSEEHLSFIETKTGRLYRSFAYVKKTDILPDYKDETVSTESSEHVTTDTLSVATNDTIATNDTVAICDTTVVVCDSLIIDEAPVIEPTDTIATKEVQEETSIKKEEQPIEEVPVVEKVVEEPEKTVNGTMLDEKEEREMLKNYSLSSVSKYLGKLKRANKLAAYGVKKQWDDNSIVYIFFTDYNDVVRGYLKVINGQATNIANGNQVEVTDYISKYETGTYIWFTLK